MPIRRVLDDRLVDAGALSGALLQPFLANPRYANRLLATCALANPVPSARQVVATSRGDPNAPVTGDYLHLPEEEVPRAGIELKRSFNYARDAQARALLDRPQQDHRARRRPQGPEVRRD
jgi:hypothetical protein